MQNSGARMIPSLLGQKRVIYEVPARRMVSGPSRIAGIPSLQGELKGTKAILVILR